MDRSPHSAAKRVCATSFDHWQSPATTWLLQATSGQPSAAGRKAIQLQPGEEGGGKAVVRTDRRTAPQNPRYQCVAPTEAAFAAPSCLPTIGGSPAAQRTEPAAAEKGTSSRKGGGAAAQHYRRSGPPALLNERSPRSLPGLPGDSAKRPCVRSVSALYSEGATPISGASPQRLTARPALSWSGKSVNWAPAGAEPHGVPAILLAG
ncbi:hypothetical protein NDU88_000110 [Pleurodeles waltl]|uniref:Uncharacterized protein n=1 Tax=Pleurodeles waltl TaxID=8319 RepID=A0AAV7V832_PLEWA|nr:hypothetical protein NDU88_000110 [Pleurodeles waltl]